MRQHGGRSRAAHRASSSGEAGKNKERHETETMIQEIKDLKPTTRPKMKTKTLNKGQKY